MNCFQTNISFKKLKQLSTNESIEAKAEDAHIHPASKANKKKVGSNHCPPKRTAVTVDPCASLCKLKKAPLNPS